MEYHQNELVNMKKIVTSWILIGKYQSEIQLCWIRLTEFVLFAFWNNSLMKVQNYNFYMVCYKETKGKLKLNCVPKEILAATSV